MSHQCLLVVCFACLAIPCLTEDSCTGGRCEAPTNDEIVELLQTASHISHRRAETSLKTDSIVDASSWQSHRAHQPVTKDPKTGEELDPTTLKPCSLCGNPVPERVAPGVVYQHRTDCGSAKDKYPNQGYMDVPLITLSKPATAHQNATNAWCELNMQKVCADSVYNKDYLYQAKVVQYPATETFDPWYCYHNGWLNPELRELTLDFDKMDKHQKDMCNTQKYLKYGWNTTLTLAKMMKVYGAGMERTPRYPTPEEATFLGAWNCAMGTAGCDISYCAYSFCVLRYEFGGTPVFGQYDECEGWDPIKGMPIPKSE